MNDEGIGIAGWLLADLTLVLALIFLALVPGRATAPPPAPVIADIGCSHTAEAMPVVTCEPTVEGERPLTFEWEVEHGEPKGALDEPTLTAAFDSAGWVKLLVRNEGGAANETYPVIPPAPTPEPTPETGLLQADFRFDQLVLSGIGSGPVSDDEIANARVREGLRKEQEDTKDDKIDDWSWDLTAEELLRRRQDGGWRIALIETFSRSHPVGNEVAQSRSVNEAFFTYLRERGTPPNGCIFLGGPDTVENDWTAAYLDRTHLDAESSRINLYFVWEPDAACDPSP